MADDNQSEEQQEHIKQFDTSLRNFRLIGRYTYAEYKEVELCGNAEALQSLASRLSSPALSETISLSHPENVSPAPYEYFLAHLQIRKGGEQVRIRVEEGNLDIEGSQSNLCRIAQQIADLINDGDPPLSSILPHLHIEYYSDHAYLDTLSIPLIIVCEKSVPTPQEQLLRPSSTDEE